jgi:hypothetical protein
MGVVPPVYISPVTAKQARYPERTTDVSVLRPNTVPDLQSCNPVLNTILEGPVSPFENEPVEPGDPLRRMRRNRQTFTEGYSSNDLSYAGRRISMEGMFRAVTLAGNVVAASEREKVYISTQRRTAGDLLSRYDNEGSLGAVEGIDLFKEVMPFAQKGVVDKKITRFVVQVV